MKRSQRVPMASWLLGGSLLGFACSLTVPEEDEFFGSGDSSDGGTTLGGRSGAGTNGGSVVVSGRGGSAATLDAGNGGNGRTEASGAGGQLGSGARAAGGAGAGGSPSDSAGMGGSAGAGTSGPFDPDEGLLAHYRFDETSGMTAHDEISAANDAAIEGTPSWSPEGKIGGALRLSGQATYVELPPDFLLEQEELSLSIWFNQTTRSAWTRVFDFGSSITHWVYFVPEAVWPTESPTHGAHTALDVANIIAAELHMPEQFPFAEPWVHVLISWKKTRFACYIDGALAGQKTDPGPGYSPGDFAALVPTGETLRAWLGRSSFPADAYFSGMLDDLRIYDRALSATEVEALVALDE